MSPLRLRATPRYEVFNAPGQMTAYRRIRVRRFVSTMATVVSFVCECGTGLSVMTDSNKSGTTMVRCPGQGSLPGTWFGFFGLMYPAYVRGEAYLAAHQNAEAAA